MAMTWAMTQQGLMPNTSPNPDFGISSSPLTPVHSPIRGGTTGPPPLPDFTFPARPALSAPASFAGSRNGTRPMSASGVADGASSPVKEHSTRRKAPPALPAFRFNPAVDAEADAYASPPVSPTSNLAMSLTTASNHRRGTSELIRGDRTTGSGTGHTNDNVLPRPSERKHGHAHRRSGAISCHQISFVFEPSTGNTIRRSGSAPTLPADQEYKSFPGIGTSTRPPLGQDHSTLGPATENDAPPRSINRVRVGFSDNVEFIPRPLSIVSSDTSSTVTIRQGHSVSNSMSSIISGSVGSSPSGKGFSSASQDRSIDNEGRPRTAGPILDTPMATVNLSDHPANSMPLCCSPVVAEAASNKAHSPVSPKVPSKKWNIFSNNAPPEQSPTRSQPSSANDAQNTHVSPPPSPASDSTETPTPSVERTLSRRPSLMRKPSKKKKKVKAWAGIISRKPLHRKPNQKAVARRSPTPPLRQFAPLNEVAGAGDEAVIPSNQEPQLQVQTGFASWKPKFVPSPEDESMSPVIDLDAALGPFNTPSSYDPTWELLMKNTGAKKRTMHSAAGMSGFVGAGMHYHRRAESAPEFENPRFGLNCLVSNSTMEDVFEEDEEESACEDTKVSEKVTCTKPEEESTTLRIDTTVADAVGGTKAYPVDSSATSAIRGVKRKGSGLSEGDRMQIRPSMKVESTSVHDEAITGKNSQPAEIVCEIGERPNSRASHLDHESATSRLCPAKILEPIEISILPTRLSPASPVSPTDSPRSPVSDTQRIVSTAPSSLSEDHTTESLMGEPGPELIRMSVDEVPSLSSTISTTTKDSSSIPSSGFRYREGQRSTSVSGPSVTKKRSSMASLSKLISLSHGEKSKLSIDSRPASTGEPNRTERPKSKRISRMMNFLRPKSTA